MATMSAAKRPRYREQQKKRQGYPFVSTDVPVIDVESPTRPGGSSTRGCSQQNVDSSLRSPPHQNPPTLKKLKVGPSYEFGLPLEAEPTASVAWKQVLQEDRRPDSPVRSIFDTRYPLNDVLSQAAVVGDVERVQSLGIKETMVAVKSYDHYVFVLTHLAEDSLKKTIADYGRLEKELKKAEESLERYKLERTQLEGDLEKYAGAKERLDSEVATLRIEKKSLSDRETAQLELGKCEEMLADMAAHFPTLAAGSSLAVVVRELKESIAENF